MCKVVLERSVIIMGRNLKNLSLSIPVNLVSVNPEGDILNLEEVMKFASNLLLSTAKELLAKKPKAVYAARAKKDIKGLGFWGENAVAIATFLNKLYTPVEVEGKTETVNINKTELVFTLTSFTQKEGLNLTATDVARWVDENTSVEAIKEGAKHNYVIDPTSIFVSRMRAGIGFRNQIDIEALTASLVEETEADATEETETVETVEAPVAEEVVEAPVVIEAPVAEAPVETAADELPSSLLDEPLTGVVEETEHKAAKKSKKGKKAA